MLTLSDTRPSRHCEGLVRRDFLGVGSLALGGMGLAQMLSVRQALAAAGQTAAAGGMERCPKSAQQLSISAPLMRAMMS